MARQVNTIARLFAPLIIGAGLIGSAHAQDCPRGDLDKAYCDRNGDLVADAPTDPKQLVNPSTLIFAYTPVEDPAVYARSSPIEFIQKALGGELRYSHKGENGAISHAEMRVGDSMIMIGQARGEWKPPKTPRSPPSAVWR